MSDNPLLIVGFVVAVAVVLGLARLWLFISSSGALGRATRITEQDSHLSFDQRIADRMRDLESEPETAPVEEPPVAVAPSAQPHFTPPAGAVAVKGFGRRGL